jgi:hypothetical protein
MMKMAMTLLLMSLVIVGMSAVYAQTSETVATAPRVQPVQMTSTSFVGDIHGARALAAVSFERLYNYVLMAGQIRSGQFFYTFRTELVGASGFGEMLNHLDGQRFQIRIDLMPAGFALTSNPFGPGMPTTYYFKRQ